MATLVLQLGTHHRTETLPALFASLSSQTDKDWTLYWCDDASTPEERAMMRQILEESHPSYTVVTADSDLNIGFSGVHERLYEMHDADYVMLVNDDAILEPGYVAGLRAHLDTHPDVASVSGKILRYNTDASGAIVKTEVIDSLGLARTRYHKVYDIGAGERAPEMIGPVQVFGVSGCLPMYRRSAIGDQLFDPSYFMYKEDVDVAYRLQAAGFEAAIVPEAVAYHKRSFRKSVLHLGVSRKSQWLSYRNHWRNLRKHLTLKDWLLDGWAILPFEAAKAIFMLVRSVV